ncbi:lysozyme [Chryseobacterium ureilyticum]|uniref:Lysozyme n=1 Tax=Chryseobacterium ureilyticum TaxID=373668 RepID=A0A1N7QRT6_9FLAO|nr:lysozyme [Chryseobacterium ureilyticum]SIT25602.1 lysozyme [Chryseobacterium ureilyticum]
MANFQFLLQSTFAFATWEADKMLDLSGQKFLSTGEGIKYTAYLDSVGKWTIGRGVTYYEDGSPVKKGDTVSVEREKALFLNTLKEYVANVNKKVTSKINQNQFNALVSLCYNIGCPNFNSSTLLKKVNENPNDPSIRNAFASWKYGTIKGKKQVIPGLVNRRKHEANLYFSK